MKHFKAVFPLAVVLGVLGPGLARSDAYAPVLAPEGLGQVYSPPCPPARTPFTPDGCELVKHGGVLRLPDGWRRVAVTSARGRIRLERSGPIFAARGTKYAALLIVRDDVVVNYGRSAVRVYHLDAKRG